MEHLNTLNSSHLKLFILFISVVLQCSPRVVKIDAHTAHTEGSTTTPSAESIGNTIEKNPTTVQGFNLADVKTVTILSTNTVSTKFVNG